jgi:circadian clock protein KaiB
VTEPHYHLTLFVSGASELSQRAIGFTRRLCDEQLPGRHVLSVVDVNDLPAGITDGRMIAAPTLVRTLPLPERRIVGDLSSRAQVMTALDIPASEAPPSPR